jgi:hypothetical protein
MVQIAGAKAGTKGRVRAQTDRVAKGVRSTPREGRKKMRLAGYTCVYGLCRISVYPPDEADFILCYRHDKAKGQHQSRASKNAQDRYVGMTLVILAYLQ